MSYLRILILFCFIFIISYFSSAALVFAETTIGTGSIDLEVSDEIKAEIDKELEKVKDEIKSNVEEESKKAIEEATLKLSEENTQSISNEKASTVKSQIIDSNDQDKINGKESKNNSKEANSNNLLIFFVVAFLAVVSGIGVYWRKNKFRKNID